MEESGEGRMTNPLTNLCRYLNYPPKSLFPYSSHSVTPHPLPRDRSLFSLSLVLVSNAKRRRTVESTSAIGRDPLHHEIHPSLFLAHRRQKVVRCDRLLRPVVQHLHLQECLDVGTSSHDDR